MIKLIVAIGPNGLIGNGKDLAWHLPEEFKHFKQTTQGHALLFGKNTFLGIGKKLPNRENIALSKEDIPLADRTIHNDKELAMLFNEFVNSEKHLFIAGGKYVYENYYMYADELIISEVNVDAVGDVFLKLNLKNYELTRVEHKTGFDVKYYKVKNV